MRAVPLQCLCHAYRQLLMIKRVWGARWLLEHLHRVKTADGFTLGGMPQLSTSVMWHLCFPAARTAVTYVLHVLQYACTHDRGELSSLCVMCVSTFVCTLCVLVCTCEYMYST